MRSDQLQQPQLKQEREKPVNIRDTAWGKILLKAPSTRTHAWAKGETYDETFLQGISHTTSKLHYVSTLELLWVTSRVAPPK